MAFLFASCVFVFGFCFFAMVLFCGFFFCLYRLFLTNILSCIFISIFIFILFLFLSNFPLGVLQGLRKDLQGLGNGWNWHDVKFPKNQLKIMLNKTTFLVLLSPCSSWYLLLDKGGNSGSPK